MLALVRLHPRLFAASACGAFVFAVCTVTSSIAVEWSIDHAILPRFDEGAGVGTGHVVIACALVVGIGLCRAGGFVIRRRFNGAATWRIAETLQGRVVDRLVAQPVSWHQRFSGGQLIARGCVDVETAARVLNVFALACGTVLLLVTAAAYLIVTDVLLGVLAVAVFPVVVVINAIYEQRVGEHFEAAQEALGTFTSEVHESFEAVHLVKIYGAEQREADRLAELAGAVRDPRMRAAAVRAMFESVLEVVPALVNIGLIAVGAWRVRSGSLTIGELSGFVYLFTVLMFPLRTITGSLSDLPQAYAGYRRAVAMIDDPLDPDPAAALGVAAAPAAVVLDDVTFRHGGGDATIDHVTATIPAGRITAIVGPTGAGKSTLLDLIGGLLLATDGSVAVAPGPRGIVFQEAFLFGGTIRDNVAVGMDPDEDLDDQVWAALQLACADTFVAGLPTGLDTVVGERGMTLSGGQRQRIALARALIRHPGLLLLDDTTSALDPATELAVLENLRGAMTGTTVVIVASRPSTIALADDVLFIDRGRLIDHGSHDALCKRQPGYRDLVDAFEADRGHDATGSAVLDARPA